MTFLFKICSWSNGMNIVSHSARSHSRVSFIGGKFPGCGCRKYEQPSWREKYWPPCSPHFSHRTKHCPHCCRTPMTTSSLTTFTSTNISNDNEAPFISHSAISRIISFSSNRNLLTAILSFSSVSPPNFSCIFISVVKLLSEHGFAFSRRACIQMGIHQSSIQLTCTPLMRSISSSWR